MLRSSYPELGLCDLRVVWVGEMRLKAGRGVSGSAGQLPLLPSTPVAPLPSLGVAHGRATTFYAIQSRSVLNNPAATHMPFWSVNPYIGCEFGCTYCYARDTHRYAVERATWPAGQGVSGSGGQAVPVPPTRRPADPLSTDPRIREDPFEKDILVKVNAAALLPRTLNPERVGSQPIVIGTATDPYQPAERRYRITRGLLESLLPFRGLHLGLITKSPLITRDVDVLTRLAERHLVRIYISLAALDGRLVRRLEARSPAPHTRLRALARLARAGLDVGLLAAPIIPGITDGRDQLAALFRAAKEAGARRVSGEALRLGPAARRHFLPLLAREFPELAERYTRRYAHRHSAGPDYVEALKRRIEGIKREIGLASREEREKDSGLGGVEREKPFLPLSPESFSL